MASLDDEQIGELRQIFRSFDMNNDNSLSGLEFNSLLRSLGLSPSPDQLQTITEKADRNNNGLIEFSEFVALVAPELARSPYSEKQMRVIFKMFDRDGNGFVTAKELADSMERLGHELTAEELTGMMEEADADGDGQISFEEFCRALSCAAFQNAWT